jgi:hypothetical protein
MFCEELWIHLEKTFKPGMTRENHGEWHIDHIIPCLVLIYLNLKNKLNAFITVICRLSGHMKIYLKVLKSCHPTLQSRDEKLGSERRAARGLEGLKCDIYATLCLLSI